jgi:hypothetical protein
MALFNTDALQKAIAEAQRQSSPDYVEPPPPNQAQMQAALDAVQKRALQVGDPIKIDPAIIAIVLAVAIPGVGAAIGEQLMAAGIVSSEVTATAIGTGIASVGAQVAQGVPIEQAIKNAVVSAGISGYAPGVAEEVNQYLKNPAVSDMIVSAGASAVKTAAAGGSEKDIVNSMAAGVVGSGVANVYESAGKDYTRSTGRLLGAGAAGAVTGGGTGAAVGALGELGSQYNDKTGMFEKPKTATTPTTPSTVDTALATADPTATNLPTQDPTATTQSTIDAPSATADLTDRATNSDPNYKPALSDRSSVGTLPEIVIRARRENIFTPPASNYYSPPSVSSTDVPEISADEQETPADEPETSKKYKPNLFVRSTVSPKSQPTPAELKSNSVLSTALNIQPVVTQGLTGFRGAGEIESQQTGKPRKKVWNEESLRLKDALGV